jgi:hypothetical protein
MEMVVIILVIGILGSIAAVGTNSVLNRATDNSKTLWVTDWLIAAQSMYSPRSVIDPTYTYEQALIEMAADLNAYVALDEGSYAVDTTVNNYRIQTDTGPSVYSTAANHVVTQEAPGTLYIAVMLDSSRAVFGKVRTSGAPEVWIATCSTTSCDAEQARNNPRPASGGYTPDGTITSTTSAATTTTPGATTSLAPTTTIAGAPLAPTAVTATISGGTTALVSYTAPTVAGSSPISAYRSTCTSSDGGSTRTSTSRANPMPVYVLSFGKSYTCTVAAKNQSGFSPESAASAVLLPYAAPAAPVITAVGSSDAQLSLSFTPGSSNGSAITNYEYSLDAGFTWITRTPASTSSPIAVIGVSNNRSYTVALRAVNQAGPGAATTASSTTSGTPSSGPPGAPTILGITPGDSQLSVSLQPPLAIGGSAISNYQYSTDSGTTWSTRSPASAASPLVIPGLTNATTYQVAVRAMNTQGTGPMSAIVEATAYTTPCAPTIQSIAPGLGQVTLAFSTPPCTGGMPITNYEYSTDNGSSYTALSPASTTSPFIVSGLDNGTLYQFRVRAVNIGGAGAASAAFAAMPSTIPDPPTISVITSTDGTLTVAFSAPASNGGAPVTSYQYSLNSGAWASFAGSTSPQTISGLTVAASYSVRIRAQNLVGPSAASAAVTKTADGPPSPPTLVSAAAASSSAISVTWSFTDPGDLAGFVVKNSGGTTVATVAAAARSASIGSLAQNTSYTFYVQAQDAAGNLSAASSSSSATTSNAPPPAPSPYWSNGGRVSFGAYFGSATYGSYYHRLCWAGDLSQEVYMYRLWVDGVAIEDQYRGGGWGSTVCSVWRNHGWGDSSTHTYAITAYDDYWAAASSRDFYVIEGAWRDDAWDWVEDQGASSASSSVTLDTCSSSRTIYRDPFYNRVYAASWTASIARGGSPWYDLTSDTRRMQRRTGPGGFAGWGPSGTAAQTFSQSRSEWYGDGDGTWGSRVTPSYSPCYWNATYPTRFELNISFYYKSWTIRHAAFDTYPSYW